MIDKYVNAAELKALLSSLLLVLGALAVAGLFAVIVVPGLRNANRPPAPMPVNPVVGEPGWLDPTEFPAEKGREIPPVDANALIADAPEWVERGKGVFATNCSSCHGELGRGNGPAAATMNPRPRNFTSPDGWRNGYDLPTLYQTLRVGVKGTSMAAFDYLSKTDRMAVAHYLQSLGAFPHGAGSSDALESLVKELAAPGGRTPNRIPVSMALARLRAEFSAPPPIAVPPEGRGPEGELLRRVIVDPVRSAQTLAGNPSWRTAPQQLAASIVPGIPENGFAVRVATLTAAEWQVLHSELLKRLPVPASQEGSERAR